MEKVIIFLTTNNVLIIKSIFGFIFFLLIIYVYRLLFVSTASSSSGDGALSEVIEKKLNQLIENQKNQESKDSENKAEPVTYSSANEADLEKYKQEVITLKQQLADAEKQIEAAKSAAPVAAPVADAGAGSEAQAQQIKTLQARLEEYEIIAEDIAELSQLRAENASLKAQLGMSGEASASKAAAAAPVAEELANVETEAKAEEPAETASDIVSEQETPASIPETPANEVPTIESTETVTTISAPEPSEEVSKEVSIDALQDLVAEAASMEAAKPHSENEVVAAAEETEANKKEEVPNPIPVTNESDMDAIVSQLMAQDIEAAPAEVAAPVTTDDQNLINEFEKKIEKKG